MTEDEGRQIRTDIGSAVRPGYGWVPIGYGLEAKADLTDPVGTYWLRSVPGDVLRLGTETYEVVRADLFDVDTDYRCYTVWVSRPTEESGVDG